jgi:uncharacterized protein Yka (UPF0111/DUF47 family)
MSTVGFLPGDGGDDCDNDNRPHSRSLSLIHKNIQKEESETDRQKTQQHKDLYT